MADESIILKAALELAATRPVDQITYADIAEAVGVHWTTVRRHLGSKQEMRSMLAERKAEAGQAAADTRTRILEAATRIFARYGYSGASLDQVAAEAGLTKGAVYWHFTSKGDLYLAICERSLTLQAQSLPRQADAILGAEDPRSALAAWLKRQLEAGIMAPEMPRLFFEFLASSRDPVIQEKLRATFAVFFDRMGEMFQELQRRGLIHAEVDARSLAVYIQTVLNGLLITWMMAPESMELDRFVSDIAALIWSGLNPKTGK